MRAQIWPDHPTPTDWGVPGEPSERVISGLIRKGARGAVKAVKHVTTAPEKGTKRTTTFAGPRKPAHAAAPKGKKAAQTPATKARKRKPGAGKRPTTRAGRAEASRKAKARRAAKAKGASTVPKKPAAKGRKPGLLKRMAATIGRGAKRVGRAIGVVDDWGRPGDGLMEGESEFVWLTPKEKRDLAKVMESHAASCRVAGSALVACAKAVMRAASGERMRDSEFTRPQGRLSEAVATIERLATGHGARGARVMSMRSVDSHMEAVYDEWERKGMFESWGTPGCGLAEGVSVALDNAQSGGPKVDLTDDDGVVLGTFYPYGGSWNFGDGIKGPGDFPVADGLPLARYESEGRRKWQTNDDAPNPNKVATIEGYHVTFADNLPSIQRRGLVPRFNPPAGQMWEPAYRGTYFHQDVGVALRDVEQSYAPMAIVHFNTRVSYRHVFPDEDMGEPEEVERLHRAGAPLVITITIPPTDITGFMVGSHVLEDPVAYGLPADIFKRIRKPIRKIGHARYESEGRRGVLSGKVTQELGEMATPRQRGKAERIAQEFGARAKPMGEWMWVVAIGEGDEEAFLAAVKKARMHAIRYPEAGRGMWRLTLTDLTVRRAFDADWRAGKAGSEGYYFAHAGSARGRFKVYIGPFKERDQAASFDYIIRGAPVFERRMGFAHYFDERSIEYSLSVPEEVDPDDPRPRKFKPPTEKNIGRVRAAGFLRGVTFENFWDVCRWASYVAAKRPEVRREEETPVYGDMRASEIDAIRAIPHTPLEPVVQLPGGWERGVEDWLVKVIDEHLYVAKQVRGLWWIGVAPISRGQEPKDIMVYGHNYWGDRFEWHDAWRVSRMDDAGEIIQDAVAHDHRFIHNNEEAEDDISASAGDGAVVEKSEWTADDGDTVEEYVLEMELGDGRRWRYEYSRSEREGSNIASWWLAPGQYGYGNI